MGGFRKGVNGRENHSGHSWEQRGLSRGLAAPSPVSVCCMLGAGCRVPQGKEWGPSDAPIP